MLQSKLTNKTKKGKRLIYAEHYQPDKTSRSGIKPNDIVKQVKNQSTISHILKSKLQKNVAVKFKHRQTVLVN